MEFRLVLVKDVVQVIESNGALVEEVAKMPGGQVRLDLSLWYVDSVNKHESVNPRAVNDALGPVTDEERRELGERPVPVPKFMDRTLASAGSESSRHTRANWEAYEAGLRAEGEEKARAEMLLTVFESRFGGCTELQRARVLAAKGDQLKGWLLRALHADSVEAALGEG